MRKNIAICSAGWNDIYQETIVSGAIKGCEQYDFNLSSFLSFNIDLQNLSRNTSSYNIYNLVNEKVFSGLIVLVNTILSREIVDAMLDHFKGFSIPVVLLDNTTAPFYSVGTDNYLSMKHMVEHFIVHHHATRINFVSGPDYNEESRIRLKAYCDALTEHGIPIEEERIFHGDFQTFGGSGAVDQFVKDKDYIPFPHAIVFANDNMAIAGLQQLFTYGYKVPDDVLISGYDDTINAQSIDPQIATVGRPLFEAGRMAVEIINSVFEGKHFENRNVLIPGECIFRESCGCKTNEKKDYFEEYRSIHQENTMNQNKFIYLSNLMLDRFSTCKDIDEMLEELKYFIANLSVGKFFLCFTEQLILKFRSPKNKANTHNSGFLLDGYSDTMYIPIAYEDNKFTMNQSFNVIDILPDLLLDSEERKNYLFIPMHFQAKPMGYIVLCNCEFMMYNHAFLTWINGLTYIIQTLSAKEEIRRVALELDKMYVQDPLTGLYNRFGFSRFTKEMLKNISKEDKIVIFFADIDDMKLINDQYGHEVGDSAIVTVANLLKKACQHDEIVARFGGDEFVVFGIKYEEEYVNEFRTTFERLLEKYNSSQAKITIKVSIGHFLSPIDKKQRLDRYIEIADSQMYYVKYGRKTNVR